MKMWMWIRRLFWRLVQDFPPCFRRVTEKALIIEVIEGEVRILLRPEGGGWEIPGGGWKNDETMEECLKRELWEEIEAVIEFIAPNPTYTWAWRYKKQRGLRWYDSFVETRRVKLKSFNPAKARFFSQADLEHIKLCEQANGLRGRFDPKDFLPLRELNNRTLP